MHRDFSLRVKSIDDAGTFTGIASTYGGVDMVGDTIAPGAYKQAIAQQGAGYPLLFAHDQSQPLGVGKISDSAAGLLVNGSLVMADPAVARVLSHMKAGSIRGLSIGYTVPDGKAEMQRDGGRLLKEIRLHEISLVAVPADPGAVITGVKGAALILGKLKPDDLSQQDRAVLVAALKRLTGASDAACGYQCDACLLGDCDVCEGCNDSNCMGLNCAGGQDPAEMSCAPSPGSCAQSEVFAGLISMRSGE